MKKITLISSLVMLCIAGVVAGSTMADRLYNKEELKNTPAQGAKQSAVWVREEIPTASLGSDFSVNVEELASGGDVIIGVKKVSAGQPTKLYAGLVEWKNRSDAEAIKKNSGVADLKSVKNVQNCLYDFSGDSVKLSPPLEKSIQDGTYILYLEIPQDKNVGFQKGNDTLMNSTQAGIYYGGKFESFELSDPTQLLLELNFKKTLEKYEKAGINVKVTREEEKNEK